MRRIVLAGLVTGVALVALAIPASASFDSHFTVIEKTTSHHQFNNGFSFSSRLVSPFNHSNSVGRDHVRCVFKNRSTAKCRAVVHLNGEVGGFGRLKVNGNIGRGDDRLNIVGGTHNFNGVGGKILVHGNRLDFSLVR